MRTINKMVIQPNTPNDNKVLWLNKNNASYYNNGTWVTIGESSEDMRELEEKVDSLDVDMQTVENEIQDINSRHNTLNTKHESLSRTVQGIAATGGASTATNVTYDNNASGLNAENAQDAIDELSSIGHFAKRGGVVNISTNYNSEHTAEVLTLAQAINKVPSKDRTLGFVATFLTTNGWVLYQFNGNSLTEWLDTSNWVLSIKFNDLTDLEKQIFQTYSIDGEFVNPQGKVLSDPERPFCRTDYINIKYADRIVIRDGFSNQYCCTVAFYDKNKKFIEGIINPLNKEGKYSGVIKSSNFPEGTEYVIATSYTTYRDRSLITVLPTTKVIDLLSNVEQSITPKYIHGFINTNGELVNYDDAEVEDYCRTDYLWIKNTEYIRIVGAYSNQYISSYTFYDRNKNALESHVGAVGENVRLGDIIILSENIPKGAFYLAVTSRLSYTDKQVFIKKAVSEAVSEAVSDVSKAISDVSKASEIDAAQAIAPDTILSSKDIKDVLTGVGWVQEYGTIYPDNSWSNGKVMIPSGAKYIKMSGWDATPIGAVHLLFLDDEDSIVGKISLNVPYVESVIPNRATKVHLCVRNSYKDKFRFGFFYSESPSSLQHDVSSLQHDVSSIIGGTTIADLSAVNQKGFISNTSGDINMNDTWVYGTIPLTGINGTITFNNLPEQQYSVATWNLFINKEGNIMSEGTFRGNVILGAGVVEVDIPSGAYGLMMTASAANVSTYDIKITYSGLKESIKEDLNIPKHSSLCCPDRYYAIVGKEFNIYYDSVIQGLDNGLLSPFGIYVNIECPDLQNGANIIGVRKDRMWQIKGNLLTDFYVGDHNMWISAWDDFGNLIDRKKVTLTVTANSQLSDVKRILCIGDSLTNNGPIVATCGQHFKDLGGTQPIFIGQRTTSGYKHEGYPGYTFGSFVSSTAGYTYRIFDIPAGTSVSINDKYETNGTQYVIKDIRTEGLDNALRLRCERSSGTNEPTETGTLTKISGASSSALSIEYSAYEAESGNPFWDFDTGADNFTKYREKMGIGNNKFDIVVIMLGTNDCIGNIKSSMQGSVDTAITLVNKIFEDAGNYPTKVIVQMTPPDANSISSWQVYEDSSGYVSGKKMGYWHNLWNLRRLLYAEFTKEEWNGKVYLGQASLGVDRYYGYPYVEEDSSSRIAIKEIFHNNSVHPNTQGYQQLGDGYYLQIKSLL